MYLKAGDKVQFFGSKPLPHGGYPYHGSALVDYVDKLSVSFVNLPSEVEPGDYMVKV